MSDRCVPQIRIQSCHAAPIQLDGECVLFPTIAFQ